MRFAPFVIAVLLLPAVCPLAAQEPPPMEVGQRVRFWTQDQRIATYGTLSRWSADSIQIDVLTGPVWVLRTAITRFEAPRGEAGWLARKPHLVGGLVGVAIGAAVGINVDRGNVFRSDDSGRLVRVSPKRDHALGAVAFGAVGYTLGALTKLFIKTGGWEEVPLDQVQVSFARQRDDTLILGLVASPPVKPGDRVRVTAPDFGINKYNGSLVSATRDTIAVDTLRIALASVTRLEVRRQKYSRGARVALGAGGGLIGGAPSGALLGFAVCSGESNSGSFCADPGAGAAIGAVLFGGTGLVFGAVYGLFASTERWEEVPLDRVRVSFGPQRDGRFGFGASVRF